MSKYSVHDLPENIPKNLSVFRFEEDMLKITKPLREKLGFNYFSHMIHFQDGRITGLLTSQDVALHWIINKWFLPGRYCPPGYYFIPSMGNLFPESYRKSLLEMFNMDNMFGIILISHSYKEIFTFSTEPDNTQIVNFYLNNLTVLKNFIVSYKENAKSLIEVATGEGIISPPVPKIIKDFKWTEIFSNDSQNNIKINNKIRLTGREVECLTLISKGKTAKEIGRIINISPRTVEGHLSNSKDKLNCHFKSELIEKFLSITENAL